MTKDDWERCTPKIKRAVGEAVREQADLGARRVLTKHKIRARVAHLLQTYSVPQPGQEWSYLQKFASGMSKRLPAASAPGLVKLCFTPGKLSNWKSAPAVVGFRQRRAKGEQVSGSGLGTWAAPKGRTMR